jgi:hypothetical protein
MTLDPDKIGFGRVVLALGPYRDDVVIVGGWAQRLFRLHPLAASTAPAPLITLDADIAAPSTLSKRGRTLRELLLGAHFVETLSGSEKPPKATYRLDAAGSVSVEFITPLVGGGFRRDGTVDATATIQGVSAEKLRHVELLLVRPWTVELAAADGYAIGEHPFPVRICNPASYLAQKLLGLPSRRPSKRGKDVLYIHDTLLLFGAALDELRAVWTGEIRRQVAKKGLAQVLGASEQFFGGVTDLSREAASVARGAGRSISAGELAAACRLGLSEIFGA